MIKRKKDRQYNDQKKGRIKTNNGGHRKLKINNNYSLYIVYHIIFTQFKPRQDITVILQDVVTH